MKIGIITHPLGLNYGGMLQAYALQRVLRDMGHDVLTVDHYSYKENYSLIRYTTKWIMRLFQHYVLRRKVSTKWYTQQTPTIGEYKIITQKTRPFVENNMCLTQPIAWQDIPKIEELYHFDAYVVGSDQVWMNRYCPMTFLDFVHRDSVRRVFYAASCGLTAFYTSPEKVRQCLPLAQKFDGISVRERSLLSVCSKYLNREDAECVLDPTMLLSVEDYNVFIDSDSNRDPFVFAYMLDNTHNKRKLLDAVAEKLNLKVLNGNNNKVYIRGKNKPEDCVLPPVEQWISNISRSQFVVTDSFHGTVFAILFNKPFITIANKTRGIERFESLLSLFDLRDRMITSQDDGSIAALIDKPIDYNTINNIIEEQRNASLSFLTRNLQ